MSKKKVIAVFGATGAQGGGLARAIAADTSGSFSARAITRNPESDKAKALAALGIEVVSADTDQESTLDAALAGAHAAFCVTNFWEHFSAEREGKQATAMARATKRAGLAHVIWSTLEDTRKLLPLSDSRLPTLHGQYNVPHFDSKGSVDATFTQQGAPTTFLLTSFYWENFIHFGMAPRAGADGRLVLAMPLGGAKLPGISVEDIGRCALGLFRQGPGTAGQYIGITGGILSGLEMAEAMARAFKKSVTFADVPFDVYRGLGFPGADDLGNMFQYQAIFHDEFVSSRSLETARTLNPGILSFEAWLAANAENIPLA